MKKNNKAILFLLPVIAVLVIAFAHYLITGPLSIKGAPAPQAVDERDYFTITSIDVGKGDCSAICQKDTVCLIDAGPVESYSALDSFLKARGTTVIDTLIITHYDQDHIGGALNLLKDYPVNNVILPNYVSDKKYYDDLMALVYGKDTTVFVKEKTTVTTDHFTIDIYPADDPVSLSEDSQNMDNNLSLLCMVKSYDRKFLFTGDIEKDRIDQLLTSNVIYSADWIKLPHHGDYSKSLKLFLETVSPTYAIISTSEDQPPKDKLIDLLTQQGVETFITYNGNVTTFLAGEKLLVHQ